MKLDWFIFEDSYLLSINYKQIECKLIIVIDARKSAKHPNFNKAKELEEGFEQIELILEGVQYYKTITSTHISNNLNEDIGNIESLNIFNDVKNIGNDDFFIEKEGKMQNLNLNFINQKVRIPSKESGVKFLELVSEYTAAQVGFKNLVIKK